MWINATFRPKLQHPSLWLTFPFSRWVQLLHSVARFDVKFIRTSEIVLKMYRSVSLWTRHPSLFLILCILWLQMKKTGAFVWLGCIWCYPWSRLKCSINAILLIPLKLSCLSVCFWVFLLHSRLQRWRKWWLAACADTNQPEHFNYLCVHYCQSSSFFFFPGERFSTPPPVRLLSLVFLESKLYFCPVLFFLLSQVLFLSESVHHSSWISFLYCYFKSLFSYVHCTIKMYLFKDLCGI